MNTKIEENNTDISVNFLGSHFHNPFILASGPPTRNGDMIREAFRNGWGGAVTKTISFNPKKFLRPRLHTLKNKNVNIGMENIELISDITVEEWAKQVKELKKEFVDRPIIASIMAPLHEKEWQELAIIMSKAGADILELNVSCPHGKPEESMGSFIGQDPILTGKVTSWVKKVTPIPVIIKLTPNVTDISIIAKQSAENGADGFAAINTVSSLIGINIETYEPWPTVKGFSTFGGYSGPGIKPISLKCVAQIVTTSNLPVSGMGGIETWHDAVEFMLLGCSTVQLCTSVMWNGYGIITDLISGLRAYLRKKQVNSVTEIIGLSRDKITDFFSLEYNDTIVAKIGENCNLCGRCIIACRDGGYQAIRKENKKVVVDSKQCAGCSLCTHICPNNNILMTEESAISPGLSVR
ncbi:MAG TPA: NAD-dependent dihydropyrimidine dehydrogenase subunit PreA [Candidatus Deferrimicrobium sp.]|nr:NAD-dependent dihydropyrimidine dehydrogenase subunit PreA [Candidatus Kapabacteria bacterium]HLP61619.1 NAD-dependent dihydropyrimidine dehydrogenase subunit PreA [Candidatus Deferrimicrobium sp.]